MSDFDFWKELAHALEHDFDALADPAFGQGARWSAAVIFRELEEALRIADDPSRHNGTHTAIARLREIVTRYERGELEDVGHAIAEAGRSAAAAQAGTSHVGEFPAFLSRPRLRSTSTKAVTFATSPDSAEMLVLTGVTVEGKPHRVVRLTEEETGAEISSRRIYPGVRYVAELEEDGST